MAEGRKADVVKEHAIEQGATMQYQSRVSCPLCGPYRKSVNQNERTLSITEKDGQFLYHCHHCDEGGLFTVDEDEEECMTETRVEWQAPVASAPVSGDPLSEAQLAWMKARGISEDTIQECGIFASNMWIHKRDAEVPCIGFPYVNADGSTAVKYRDGSKQFTQRGAARSLWRIQDFNGGDLIITEGEMDAASFAEIGVLACSVPNGAPEKTVRSSNSKKFDYLWDAADKIELADRVIIAGDQDGPGEVLLEEIARRIGKGRCWKVTYPEGCKDANDVLVKHGQDALRQCLVDSTPWPVGGLRDALEYREQALAIYRDGPSRGIDLDEAGIGRLHRPTPGTFTLVTGTPGSGKSSWLTWLSYELASKHDWGVACFAGETSSQVHLLQLAALHVGKPFEGVDKMSEAELEDAMQWMNSRFVFLDTEDTSIDSIVERIQAAVMRRGIRMATIDPFNWITTGAEDKENQQTGINQLLVRLKNLAVEHDIALYMVAHPKKMYRDSNGDSPLPTGYDISGSAHFFNVADNGITVSRRAESPGETGLLNWKTRFSWLGSLGEAKMLFDIRTGKYEDKPEWGSQESDFDFSYQGDRGDEDGWG